VRIPVFNRSKQIRPTGTKNSASYECYHSAGAKKFERASVLLCDFMHHSIILQQFSAARVLLPHAELRHLSTSINGRRRYRLDQSTPPPAAIVRRSPTQCRGLTRRIANYPVPRTNPRTLPSHYTHLTPRTSHFTITPQSNA